jgi:hypothetical protein
MYKEVIMKKSIILFILVALSGLQLTAANTDKSVNPLKAAPTFVDKIKSGISQTSSYIKNAGSYLLSTEGVKDLALAYCLGMGLTAIHEGGNAVTSKILTGARIQLVLGAPSLSGHPTYLSLGGVSLGGFNPATGYAKTGHSVAQPLVQAAICAAGPICGTLGSLAALYLLKKYDGLYITKAVAAYGLFNPTVGVAGIGGAWIPGQDINRVVKSLRDYRTS